MKKVFVFIVCLALMLGLSACSIWPAGRTSGSGANGMEFNVVSDALEVKADEDLDSFDESKYVYVFRYNGSHYRIVADMTKEVYDELDSLNDLSAEEYQGKKRKLVSNLKVRKAEDITEQFLGQESLVSLIGKTGADLTEEGFKVFAYYGDEGGSQVIMDLRAGQYLITFDDPKHKVDDDVSNKTIKKLKVTRAVYYGISYNGTEVE